MILRPMNKKMISGLIFTIVLIIAALNPLTKKKKTLLITKHLVINTFWLGGRR